MKLRQLTALGSVEEPITLSQLKSQLRIDHGDQDTHLQALISQARDFAEQYINKIIAQREFELTVDQFERCFELPLFPVKEDSIRVFYIDEAGDEQEFTELDWETSLSNTLLFPAYDASWPTDLSAGRDVVRITFTAGYAAMSEGLPQSMTGAILRIAQILFKDPDLLSKETSGGAPVSWMLMLEAWKGGYS